ncbi:MAG TPA: hypothetical protein VK832_10785 [Burkholderiaceae bacterium]|jgi:hypothetical protein|nr:hypothetical protein [Burkholderiaceae bacterium]
MKHGKIILAAAFVAVAMNLSFAGSAILGVPKGWTVTGADSDKVAIGIDPAESSDGHPGVFIENKDNTPGKVVALTQTIDAVPWQGKMVEFSVMTKRTNESVTGEIWLRGTNGIGGTSNYNSVAGEDIKTAEWKQTDLRMIVPKEITRLEIGVGLRDQGRVWLRDVKVRMLSTPSKDEQAKKRQITELVPLALPAKELTNLNFSE